MPIESRTRSSLQGPGPYLARITNLLDPSYMGAVEVSIEKGYTGSPDLQSQTYIVQYLSPFYGVTNIQHEGADSSKFNDVQKSYGMWFIPPDIGTKVLIIFLDGDPNQGYWIGCIPDKFQNHMIPGIAASKDVYLTPEQELKYGTKNLPVAEFHKRSEKTQLNPNSQKKPVHPFADRLLAQGLLIDNIRGVTSSSARREVPSSVFGISTPGPLDPNGTKGLVGYATKVSVPVSRLGGSQFVMDDGDKNGQNELVRLRTRTGHQILMHNSSDLIYIANSKGTAWIELTSNGKIDIFAKDSVSIHTESDFNFRADRDINLEASRNINIRASGSMNTNIRENYNLIVSQDGKILVNGTYDHKVTGSYKLTTAADYHVNVGSTLNQSAAGDISILSNGNNKFTAAATTHISSGGQHKETASIIHMNGPPATSATPATSAASPSPLPLFKLPNRKIAAGWSNGNFYKASDISSIMQRVPTHEPWDQHENIDIARFSSANTDVISGTTVAARSGTIPTANTPLAPPAGVDNTGSLPDWAHDTYFITAVKSTSTTLGCQYKDLLACMAFETGRTFNPALRNQIGATGLIQFISSTAKGLGTTTDYLASLTRTQQMLWVEKYFKAGPLRRVSSPSLEDLYMSILWPVAVGQLNSYVLFKAGDAKTGLAYTQNHGLDVGSKGYITKDDAASKVRSQLPYVIAQLNAAGVVD